VPLPATNSTVGEFEALLMKETLPVLLPLACGVKVKLSDMLWPAISVSGSGSDNPLTVYSELLEVAEEMVTLEPVAVRVAAKLVLLPTTTLPKSKLVGAKLN
jgi:hypothetical protein